MAEPRKLGGLSVGHFAAATGATAVLTFVIAGFVAGAVGDDAPDPQRPRNPQVDTRPTEPADTPTREPEKTRTPEKTPEATKTPEKQQPQVSLAAQIGQKLMVPVRGGTLPPQVLQLAASGRIGGVILFSEGASASTMAGIARRLQAAAKKGGHLPLLISTDQEGGQIRRMEGPPGPSATEMGAGSAKRTEQYGRETGAFLADNGVNVNLAPVADVPQTRNSFLARDQRTYGTSADAVSQHAAAFARGLSAEGVAATGKHFPGLGGTGTANTDLQAVTVADIPEAAPFETLISDGVELMMMSNATYTALDPAVPAVLSRKIVTGMLRDEMGFKGVIITDELNNPGVNAFDKPSVRAAAAGVDILLYANDVSLAVRARANLLAAVRAGTVPQSSVTASYKRIRRLKCTQLKLC